MKNYLSYPLLVLTLLLSLALTSAEAKRVVAPNMYMFGFSASFNDTIICFTEIQQVDSAWIDKKTGFLQSRDIYSGQLRDYLASKKRLPHRTCVVFYNKNRAKLEKTFVKMKRLYSKGKDGQQHFDIRMLDPDEFRFVPIDLTGLDQAEQEQVADEAKPKKSKKAGKKKP